MCLPRAHLDFAHEVSERHIVLNNEVGVETFGGDAALLLHRRTVVNASATGVLLHPGGGRAICLTCRTGARECRGGSGNRRSRLKGR